MSQLPVKFAQQPQAIAFLVDVMVCVPGHLELLVKEAALLVMMMSWERRVLI